MVTKARGLFAQHYLVSPAAVLVVRSVLPVVVPRPTGRVVRLWWEKDDTDEDVEMCVNGIL